MIDTGPMADAPHLRRLRGCKTAQAVVIKSQLSEAHHKPRQLIRMTASIVMPSARGNCSSPLQLAIVPADSSLQHITQAARRQSRRETIAIGSAASLILSNTLRKNKLGALALVSSVALAALTSSRYLPHRVSQSTGRAKARE